MLENYHCNFVFFKNLTVKSCSDIECADAVIIPEAKYLKILLEDLNGDQVFLDCYPSYIVNTSTDISISNGFSYGEIVLSIFGFLIVIILAYKFYWDTIHKKIDRSEN